MGLLKSQKLDNNNVGFECIYGGLEAPFGGIDASKNPRYIDPKCFADASNFLIVDNELCILNLFLATFPTPDTHAPATGVTFSYPVTIRTFLGYTGTTYPALLIGIGKLPCEGIVKNWALYCSTATDSQNFWHYRLILWETEQGSTIEAYDFPVSGQTITYPATPATATLTVAWNDSFSAVESVPEFPLPLSAGGYQNPPYALPSGAGLVYEVFKWLFSIAGVPTNTAYPGYVVGSYTNQIFNNLYLDFFLGAPSNTFPTPSSEAAKIASIINNAWNAGYIPFKANYTSGTSMELIAETPTNTSTGGYPYYDVSGNRGNAITLSGGTSLYAAGYYPIGGGSFDMIVAPTYNPLVPFPFGIPSMSIEFSGFSGGKDPYTYQQQPIQNLTYETIGDNLYLAGYPANYMLQFNNSSKFFGYLTQYEGARVLKKIGGHLISVGLINGLDLNNNPTNFTDPHLWFSWNKEGAPGVWYDIDASGLETGAGGEQIGDISDMLTGLIVSNSIAFILRADGLSYASETQNAQIPFDINHVALCKESQGCPSVSLWTQFDQLGFYVGNSNVFMLSQSPQAVGDNILPQLVPALVIDSTPSSGSNIIPFTDNLYNVVNTEPLTFLINGKQITVFAINVNGSLYIFDPINGSWMRLDTSNVYPPSTPSFIILTPFNVLKCITLPAQGTTGYGGSFRYRESYMYGQFENNDLALDTYLNAPFLYQFLPQISSTVSAYVTFPSEEISHGRDITIDGIYVTISGQPGAKLKFNISGYQRDQDGNSTFIQNAFEGTLILDSNAAPKQYEEYQVFDDNTGGAVTMKAPQLQVVVPSQTLSPAPIYSYPFNSYPDVIISKISMFGSFDPTQRPV